MFENVRYLHEKMVALEPDERRHLATYVLQRCYLVIVSTRDMTSAYRIFSVMNDRGLDLSATDILKAEVVGDIEDAEEQHSYASKWEDVEQELGREKFGALFAHIRTIYAKAKQRRSLQEEFREHVLAHHSSKDFIESVLDQYDDAFKSVLRLPDGMIASTPVIETHLLHLDRLDNVDWIPPAMAFFHRNPHNQAHLSKFTKDLERLAYGMFIRRADINERITRYAAVLREIEKGDDIWNSNGPLQLRDDEQAKILQTLNGPIYTLPRVPKPLLLRMDGLVAEAGASYNYLTTSIEHVLPQNPAEVSQWHDWFPDDAERTQWTHRLANLVLLSSRKNTRASNWEFERKKEEYFQKGGVSPFALTTQVVAEKEWTPAVLERRQRELIGKLKEEWRLG